MKKIYFYIVIITLLFSGCDSSSLNSPKYCKENGYSGMVVQDTDLRDAQSSCSDGEEVNGYYKTSTGMKKVTAIEPNQFRASRAPGHYYLEFK